MTIRPQEEFTIKECDQLRTLVSDFSLDKPFNSYTPLPPVMHTYLEFYGFFDTLKTFDGDYFWGGSTAVVDGEEFRIATHYWRPLHYRATVFFVHGLYDHVGLFQPLIRYLLANKYAVIACDLPGHGISSGAPTKINTFFDYAVVADALCTIVEPVTQGKPLVGLGQSTGAAVLMALAFKRENEGSPQLFDRLVFTGPLVKQKGWRVGGWIYRLFGKFIKSIPRDFTFANSHDDEFHNFLRYHDPLQYRSLDISWIGALYHWQRVFSDQIPIETPLLVIQGTSDRVVAWKTNLKLIKERFPNIQINYVQGAMHHLPNEAEPWRKAIFGGITQFLRHL